MLFVIRLLKCSRPNSKGLSLFGDSHPSSASSTSSLARLSPCIHIWPLLHLQALVLRRGSVWDGKMSPSSRVLAELEWWPSSVRLWNGRSFVPRRHSHILITDASIFGWRGWWRTRNSLGNCRDKACGFFSKEEFKMSSNAVSSWPCSSLFGQLGPL